MTIRPVLACKLAFPLPLLPLLLLSFALAGCRQQADVPTPTASPGAAVEAPAAAGVAPPVVLEDVIETTPRYLIGISYPRGLEQHPGLAAELKRYAEAARGEVLAAVDGAAPDAPGLPYDLSLSFSVLADSPDLVAVAADGSSYTGGAHGNPLVARFVWLPRQGKLLDAAALVPDPRGWVDISAHVREQLHSALSQRVDADDLEAVERAQVIRSAAKMIDEGSSPDPGNFAQFEPVLGGDGRLRGLRFVFAPYQVGPYSDGVQTVEVPAAVLVPHVAPEYRSLFAP